MKVSRGDVVFQTNDKNITFWDKFKRGEWEKDTFQILDKNICTNDVFVDIGAWIGPISLYVASKVHKCYSFEPDPTAFKNLQENIKLNSKINQNIRAFNKAITDDGKDIKLYSRYSHGDSGSSILKRVKSTNKYFQVKSSTFSNFIKVEKIEKINFIKMDIEGGEFFVLPSMTDIIKEFKPTMLISFHYNALVEYYMQKLIPIGALRRIYRLIGLKSIENKAKNKMVETVSLLGYESIYNKDGKAINVPQLSLMDLSSIDMLLFKWN